MDIYVRNGIVVTVNAKREVIRDGAVAISDGEIVAVGRTEELDKDYRYKSDLVIDASRKIVIPGLINTHVHLAQALIRGCANYVSLLPWLKDYVWPLQGNYTPEIGRISALLCMVEMVKSGTTTFLESMLVGRYGVDGIAEELERIGMRGVLSRCIIEVPGDALEESVIHRGLIEDPRECMKDVERLVKKWHGKHGRIFIWYGPRTPGAVSAELYKEISERAKELGIGITMHLAEIKEDVEYTMKNFGMKPVEFAHSVGLTGPNVVLVHCVWLSDEEIKLLAETKTNVSHNPSSNAKLASGIAPVAEMLKEGVNVCLGTDGGPSNDNYDMVEEMRMAALLQPARTLDPKALPAEKALELATINGARALGLEKQIGSIEVGKRADIVLVDYWKPHMVPLHDPVAHLVYCASGQDVDTVIVDGKLVVLHGKLLTVNEEEVLEKAQKIGLDFVEKVGARSRPLWPAV